MANVFDVAKYVLEKKGRMSTWELQKLCYYAQAWSLAWDGAELFPEDFEAWRNGPVCRNLYYAHKGLFLIESANLPQGDVTVFTDIQRETLDAVLRDYGDVPPYELREMTHSEDPWRITRGGIPEEQSCEAIIPKNSMGEYYGSL